MHEFHTTRRVEFADTDLAGLVHFSRFFVFMETAEHEFLRQLGINVHFEHEGHKIGWPRAAASCEYRSPARLGDLLEIHLRVKRKGVKSMTYGFTFSCRGRLVAEGQITAICCVLDAGPGLQALPIPAFLADQITQAPTAGAQDPSPAA